MTRTVPAPATADASRAPGRALTVLVVSQVLGGAGMAAGITVGALLAQDLFDSTSLSGLPVALFTLGAALGAAALGRVCQHRGRRVGLALGNGVAAAGSAGVVAGAAAHRPVLLLAALFVYGAGTATGLLARYAGAELAPPGRRGRATGTVLVAMTLGAVAGPNLVGPTGVLAQAWGIPRLAGPFLLATAAYTAAALVLLVWLRPSRRPRFRPRRAPARKNPPAAGRTGRRAGPPGSSRVPP